MQPGGNGGGPLISRRKLLYGAIGVGAVAALGVGGAAYTSMVNNEEKVPALDVPKNALRTLSDFQALDNPDEYVQLEGIFELPYGSLVWVNDEDVAACLFPTDTGSPLAQAGLLYLKNGTTITTQEKAVSTEEGYEIYDVRATSAGLIWTEANILQGTWRIYVSSLSGEKVGEARLVDEGDDTYDTPTLAVSGTRAFWQVLPKTTNTEDLPSRLMGASFSGGSKEVVFESNRRMCTPPYGAADTVTICPRVDSAALYYELTNLDASSGSIREKLTLPHGIEPMEGGYGKTGFMFSFPNIYSFDSAIANLGTYLPVEKPSGGDYDAVKWFDFTRTPTAPPAWCDNLLIVKSTYAVCGVNLNAGTYFAIDVDDGADTYGEYLASTGTHNTFVTYTNVDHTPIGGTRTYACIVKVWKPL